MPGFSLITYLVYFAIYIQIKNRSQYFILFLCVSCNKYFFIDHFKLFVELISRDQIIFLKLQEIQNLLNIIVAYLSRECMPLGIIALGGHAHGLKISSTRIMGYP